MNCLLELPNGRVLEYLDNGIASSQAIVLHHGSPIEMYFWTSTIEWLTEKGVRAIAYSRPGYGESTRHPGRTVVGNNDDLSSLLSHLGITSFVSVGWSAGGPPALASGLLPSCRGVWALASPAPMDAEGLDYFEGKSEAVASEDLACSASLDAAIAYKRDHSDDLRALTPEMVLSSLSSRPQFATYADRYRVMVGELCASLQRGLTPDTLAFADDDYSFFAPWGVRIEDIRAHVHVWLGSNDEFIPAGHAVWLAEHLPSSELTLLEGHDHISLVVEKRDDILSGAIATLTSP